MMATAAVGLAVVLDEIFEEIPRPIHPVSLFGRLVDRVDRSWSQPMLMGVVVTVVLPLTMALIGWAVTWVVASVAPILATVVAGLWLFSAISLGMLRRVASEVIDLSETDVGRAREAVPALVGRDPSSLSPGELRSAAVESAAENLADGLVAPLFGFVIGAQHSLAAAVAAALWVKAVNTLDSMLGYASKPVGSASARLDDLVMWVPARVAAILIALAGRSPAAVGRAWIWRREPASPNSGWPMATLAALLDVKLEKPGAYVLNPEGELPTVSTARRGVDIVGVAGLLAVFIAGVVAWF